LEENFAGEDACKVHSLGSVHFAADDGMAEKNRVARRILVIRLDDDLVEMRAVDPPFAVARATKESSDGLVGGGGREFGGARVECGDFALGVDQGKEVVLGLPRIPAGILKRGGIVLAHEGESGE